MNSSHIRMEGNILFLPSSFFHWSYLRNSAGLSSLSLVMLFHTHHTCWMEPNTNHDTALNKELNLFPRQIVCLKLTRYSNACCHRSNARKGGSVVTAMEGKVGGLTGAPKWFTSNGGSWFWWKYLHVDVPTGGRGRDAAGLYLSDHVCTVALCKTRPDGVWNLVCLYHWQNQSHPHSWTHCLMPKQIPTQTVLMSSLIHVQLILSQQVMCWTPSGDRAAFNRLGDNYSQAVCEQSSL